MSREELNALIKCPIDWISETGDREGACSILQYDWYHCFNEHAVSIDEHITEFDGFDDEELDAEELKHLIANLKLRKDARTDSHENRAGRLSRLRFLRPSEHGKHFIPGAEKLILQEGSRGPVSYFHTDYRSADLRTTFWSYFFMVFSPVGWLEVYEEMLSTGTDHNISYYGRLWHRFLQESQLRVALNCLRPVGASRGKETSHVCFDIHLNAKTVHAYPVDKSQAEQIMGNCPIFCVDDLNC
jgi:hypothetical protein